MACYHRQRGTTIQVGVQRAIDTSNAVASDLANHINALSRLRDEAPPMSEMEHILTRDIDIALQKLKGINLAIATEVEWSLIQHDMARLDAEHEDAHHPEPPAWDAEEDSGPDVHPAWPGDRIAPTASELAEREGLTLAEWVDLVARDFRAVGTDAADLIADTGGKKHSAE